MNVEKYIFMVEGMSCGHCKNAVEKAVSALEGVISAFVDLPNKTLTVESDASKVTLEKIKEVVDDEGFTVVGKQ
ncbi:cation transporter [Pelosinus sp. IPA-1]|uniref:cation transporter n=1 Tax=Pelosinus sp. IPA-1 TaxID=3029569 RepID=UPI0024362332|nr:cation transporter [Pelosinus sp. IPA-1]GMA98566.1 copper chaperone CopZ [Pelosinus sp. IPA-1]